MKYKVILLSIPLIFLCHQQILYGQNFEELDMQSNKTELLEGLEYYLNKIPDGKESDFGFKSKGELQKAVLGKPMQLYKFSEKSTLNGHFSKAGLWKIPVIVDDSYRCFLDVTFYNGKIKVVGLGLNELASDLYFYESNNSLKDKNDKALFIDYSLNVYSLVTENDNKELEFIPFREMPVCNLNEFNSQSIYSMDEIIEYLKLAKNNYTDEE